MRVPKKYRSHAMAAIHETAVDLHRVGGMDKKTMRRFDALCLTPIQEMTPKEIRALRAREGEPKCFCGLPECDSGPGQPMGARRKASSGRLAEASFSRSQKRAGDRCLRQHVSESDSSEDRYRPFHPCSPLSRSIDLAPKDRANKKLSS